MSCASLFRFVLAGAIVIVPILGIVRASYAGGCTPDEAEESKWSKYKACSDQHESDRTKCNAMPDKDPARKSLCWSSANERLGKCNTSKGKTLNEPELKN